MNAYKQRIYSTSLRRFFIRLCSFFLPSEHHNRTTAQGQTFLHSPRRLTPNWAAWLINESHSLCKCQRLLVKCGKKVVKGWDVLFVYLFTYLFICLFIYLFIRASWQAANEVAERKANSHAIFEGPVRHI